MKVAAYQAPLLAAGSMDALELIRTRVKWCEAEGVTILCCPEAILGGLADYGGDHPTRFAIAAEGGQLDAVLAPLASDTVTTIVGFTELADGGRLYNSAAVFQRGSVAGRSDELVSYGSSGIVDPDGMVVESARQLSDDLIVAEINTVPRAQRRGWDASRNRAVVDEYAAHVGQSPGRALSVFGRAERSRLTGKSGRSPNSLPRGVKARR